MIEFRADFGAEDAVRLAPCKDDKPKDAEIVLFQAGSDYSLSAKYNEQCPQFCVSEPHNFYHCQDNT